MRLNEPDGRLDPELPYDVDLSEPTEKEWLQAAVRNPVFGFLHDPAEDIYTLTDGTPP